MKEKINSKLQLNVRVLTDDVSKCGSRNKEQTEILCNLLWFKILAEFIIELTNYK